MCPVAAATGPWAFRTMPQCAADVAVDEWRTGQQLASPPAPVAIRVRLRHQARCVGQQKLRRRRRQPRDLEAPTHAIVPARS